MSKLRNEYYDHLRLHPVSSEITLYMMEIEEALEEIKSHIPEKPTLPILWVIKEIIKEVLK